MSSVHFPMIKQRKREKREGGNQERGGHTSLNGSSLATEERNEMSSGRHRNQIQISLWLARLAFLCHRSVCFLCTHTIFFPLPCHPQSDSKVGGESRKSSQSKERDSIVCAVGIPLSVLLRPRYTDQRQSSERRKRLLKYEHFIV